MAMNDFSSFSSMRPVGLMKVSDDHPDVGITKAFNKRLELLAKIESRGTFFHAEWHSPKEAELFDNFE